MDDRNFGGPIVRNNETSLLLHEGVSFHRQTVKSLLHCIDVDDYIDDNKYFQYIKHKRQKRLEEEEVINNNNVEVLDDDNSINNSTKIKRIRPKRTIFRRQINKMRDPNTDELIQVTPKMSVWYQTYVNSPDIENNKFIIRFRRRFRCCYSSYQKLLVLIKEDSVFDRWHRHDAIGREPSPFELLLLGALRYLGRGWTFDDLEESTSISEECHRQFFHVFLKWGSTALFNKLVIAPANANEASTHMHEMQQAGFDGCVGSVDATHVGMMRCPYVRWNHHKGPKESLPARTYNIVVNHRRRILHSTSGHPSRWNDKTLAMFDNFLMGLNKGTILDDSIFNLQTTKKKNDEEIKFQGGWLLCDNGYPEWSCLIPPLKDPATYPELRFSDWLESMRKDVECTFGILKGRFRLLKTGVRCHGIEVTDKIWLTCCALHNMFLDEDGLAECWENGVPTDWEGNLGNHHDKDVERYASNFALRRLNGASQSLGAFDLSGVGFGNDYKWDNVRDHDNDNDNDLDEYNDNDYTNNDNINENDVDNNNVNTKRIKKLIQMKRNTFRDYLIDHFDSRFQKKQLKWPTRIKATLKQNVEE